MGPVETSMVTSEQEPGEGNPGTAGILSRVKADLCYFHMKSAKIENEFCSTEI